jgi:hypothetical protein
MDNRSMTLGNWFYLKAYCTASGRWPHCTPVIGAKRRIAGVNGAVNSGLAGPAASGTQLIPDPRRLFPFF